MGFRCRRYGTLIHAADNRSRLLNSHFESILGRFAFISRENESRERELFKWPIRRNYRNAFGPAFTAVIFQHARVEYL